MKANAVSSLNNELMREVTNKLLADLSTYVSIPINLIINNNISLTSLDPCEDKICSFNSLCVVNNNYKASCQCPKCPPTTKHVCGSDGETYVNECELRKQSCTTKTNIIIFHQGKCGKLSF